MTNHWLRCMHGILIRETLRFFQQRERFLAALVRPLVWLIVFAAGFRTALGLSIIDPYTTYIPYEVYIVPGLAAMVILFNGMQSSLSLVYDREMGSMRMLLTTPLPRWYLIFCRLLALWKSWPREEGLSREAATTTFWRSQGEAATSAKNLSQEQCKQPEQ